MAKVDKGNAKKELWRRGVLKWKCHAVQKEMYDVFYNADSNSTLVWLLSRQTGKSYFLAILALEQAIRKPNSVIKLLTDTKIHVQKIFGNIFQELLEDCPEDLKPNYHKNDYTYSFSNGSQIQLAGSDGGHYERLRGQKSDLVLVDEAGFCDNLHYVVKSVLLPTLTHTGGKIALASTPSPDPAHDFNKFIEEAELNNALIKKTIYDNPLLDANQVQRIIKEMGGINSPQFRREYLCELIRDEENVIFPEFTDELEKEIVKEWIKPPFYDCYVGMDLGGRDLTAVVFLYYDFRADKIIVEDELIADFRNKEMNIEVLTKAIQKRENLLWMNVLTNEQKLPLMRVSDINYIVTQEIYKYSHGELSFKTAKKDDNEAAINNLRVLIQNKKIIIHPRCKTLIRHLKNVKWSDNQTKSKFARSPDNGHYDAVDALKYAVRAIQFSKNPYPSHYGMNLKDLHVQNPNNFYQNDPAHVYAKIFNVKRK